MAYLLGAFLLVRVVKKDSLRPNTLEILINLINAKKGKLDYDSLSRLLTFISLLIHLISGKSVFGSIIHFEETVSRNSSY